eukprot:ctg_3773.g640
MFVDFCSQRGAGECAQLAARCSRRWHDRVNVRRQTRPRRDGGRTAGGAREGECRQTQRRHRADVRRTMRVGPGGAAAAATWRGGGECALARRLDGAAGRFFG